MNKGTISPKVTYKKSKGSYALVNGLNMYYEIHGTGKPLVLLHGGLMTIEALGPLLPALARTRQVIAAELEGHGDTGTPPTSIAR